MIIIKITHFLLVKLNLTEIKRNNMYARFRKRNCNNKSVKTKIYSQMKLTF